MTLNQQQRKNGGKKLPLKKRRGTLNGLSCSAGERGILFLAPLKGRGKVQRKRKIVKKDSHRISRTTRKGELSVSPGPRSQVCGEEMKMGRNMGVW